MPCGKVPFISLTRLRTSSQVGCTLSPVTVSSFKDTKITDYQVKGAVECLWDIFGGTVTATGHKLLDSHVGLIYGDSITLDRANQILQRLEAKGFASANVVFGIGSYTYQYNTRDTFGFAMKATWAMIDGEGLTTYIAEVIDLIDCNDTTWEAFKKVTAKIPQGAVKKNFAAGI